MIRDYLKSIDFGFDEEEFFEVAKRYNDTEITKAVDVKFPFQTIRDKSNVLGTYFDKSSKAPNVVVIIVEGLSRVFSGPGAKYHFTPYLESIIDSSLYWSNFMSNCHRTFNVPSNILGSLPYGANKRGFNFLEEYPSHQSLMSYLKGNEYDASFYYPAYAGFDRYKDFLFYQGVDRVCDKTMMFPDEEKVVAWGRTDREMFNYSLNDLKVKKEPFLDVLLTLSIHTPFDHPEERFFKKANEVCEKHKELSEVDRKLAATALYLDDCLKEYLESFKRSAAYDNTIFVITGDHNVQLLPLRNELDRYYVPLYIYSPLIKEARKIAGVSSHLNIAPSLVSLLEGNFGLNFPAKTSFVGEELDTILTFRSIKKFPLSVYDDLGQFIYQGKALVAGKAFTIQDGLKIKPSKESKQLIQMREDYKYLDRYVCKQNKWMKD